MHNATKTHISGMLSVIRQSLLSIEAAMAADNFHTATQQSKNGSTQLSSEQDDDKFLTEREETAIGELLGLVDHDEKPEPKRSGKSPKVREAHGG